MNFSVKFHNQPAIIPTGDENDSGLPTFRLIDENGFSFTLIIDGVKHEITIPKDFVTDFASFPRFLRCIDNPMDPRWLRAALAHDYLYSTYVATGDLPNITRYQADNVFFYGEKELGSPWYKRYPHYYGVRIGGKSHWKD